MSCRRFWPGWPLVSDLGLFSPERLKPGFEKGAKAREAEGREKLPAAPAPALESWQAGSGSGLAPRAAFKAVGVQHGWARWVRFLRAPAISLGPFRPCFRFSPESKIMNFILLSPILPS
ncbi:MAG: hypothetical protein DWQ01_13370 [Planctomycetota bacterium]|nr:MAG: hypothetical protein DWQ01_13370 [Planctomycetota bacterium]